MAQRKPTSGAQKRPGASSASAAKAAPAKTPVPGAKAGPGARPPVRKPGKSIVNQKQTPWGLVATTAAIVVFAVAIVVVVVATRKDHKTTQSAGLSVSKCTAMIGKNSTSYLNENKCASQISGVAFHAEPNRQHVTTNVTYDTSPPVGGNHSQYWADCTGMVYSEPIANENAVHSLEHGAIWITYNPKTISSADLTKLQNMVQGQDRELMSPYDDLKTPLSLQSWGYQLFLNSASDPRINEFINDLRYNPKTTPEYPISCSDPSFDPASSTPGHAQF